MACAIMLPLLSLYALPCAPCALSAVHAFTHPTLSTASVCDSRSLPCQPLLAAFLGLLRRFLVRLHLSALVASLVPFVRGSLAATFAFFRMSAAHVSVLPILSRGVFRCPPLHTLPPAS